MTSMSAENRKQVHNSCALSFHLHLAIKLLCLSSRPIHSFPTSAEMRWGVKLKNVSRDDVQVCKNIFQSRDFFSLIPSNPHGNFQFAINFPNQTYTNMKLWKGKISLHDKEISKQSQTKERIFQDNFTNFKSIPLYLRLLYSLFSYKIYRFYCCSLDHNSHQDSTRCRAPLTLSQSEFRILGKNWLKE